MRRVVTVFLIVVVLIAVSSRPALAHYNYIGSGMWPDSSVSWHSYAASIYDSPTAAAASDWSVWTDLTVTEVAADSEDVGTYSVGLGDPGPWARTVICSQSGCYTSGTINDQYLYVEIQYNSNAMSNFTSTQMQAVASHEFGHAFSLHHTDLTVPHIMYIDAKYMADTYNIYYSTEHDIAAINARY